MEFLELKNSEVYLIWYINKLLSFSLDIILRIKLRGYLYKMIDGYSVGFNRVY